MFIFSKIGNSFSKALSSLIAIIIMLTQGGGIMLRGNIQNLLSVYSHSFYASTEKVNKYDAIKKEKSYTMYLAKNESENCQFVMRARDDRRDSFIEIGEFKNEAGEILPSEICKVCLVETDEGINGKKPDPLVPIEKRTEFSCASECNYIFLINVKSDKATSAGDYTATITFGNTGGDPKYEQSSAEIKAHVWNFELPDAFTMDTAMGLGKSDIAAQHGVDVNSPECLNLYIEYYNFLLEHGISAYNLPYDILDSRADAYMSDPRVKSFCIPYGSDEMIKAYYDKLSTNNEWMKKAYFYPIDEPHSPENIETYNNMCARLSRLFPGYNMVTPFYTNNIDGVAETNVDIQAGKSNIICPESVLFDEASFCETVRNRVASGDKVWWYVCCGPAPTSDYCNLFVQQEGIRHRILFWQQKQYDVTGLLYWSTNYWCDTQNKDGVRTSPWNSAWSTPWTGDDTYGDGSLLYPGNRIGINGPVSSLRLEAVLNGIEDYEYLTMAEKLLGKKETDKIIKKVSNNLTDYTYSDKTFENVRIELGNMLEKAMTK